mmetsp:Transcript_3397/g.6703  ORF Transcript_3397/g.6703 Transcript_3397/m.6703 type:complete len:273 (-) Transcript_3397:227-1045(-)
MLSRLPSSAKRFWTSYAQRSQNCFTLKSEISRESELCMSSAASKTSPSRESSFECCPHHQNEILMPHFSSSPTDVIYVRMVSGLSVEPASGMNITRVAFKRIRYSRNMFGDLWKAPPSAPITGTRSSSKAKTCDLSPPSIIATGWSLGVAAGGSGGLRDAWGTEQKSGSSASRCWWMSRRSEPCEPTILYSAQSSSLDLTSALMVRPVMRPSGLRAHISTPGFTATLMSCTLNEDTSNRDWPEREGTHMQPPFQVLNWQSRICSLVKPRPRR